MPGTINIGVVSGLDEISSLAGGTPSTGVDDIVETVSKPVIAAIRTLSK